MLPGVHTAAGKHRGVGEVGQVGAAVMVDTAEVSGGSSARQMEEAKVHLPAHTEAAGLTRAAANS